MGMQQGDMQEVGECREDGRVKPAEKRRGVVNTPADLDIVLLEMFNINLWEGLS